MRIMPIAAALAAASFIALLGASPAAAAAAEDEPITWSVRPGDEEGQDGRAWVEWDADPGDGLTEHMVVTNHGAIEVEFQLSAADAYFTDTGRFNMLPSDAESVDAGTWIDLPESVVVPAGATEVVPFTITVPANATPGDHPAGVAASVMSDGAGAIGVESRVGFRVMTRPRPLGDRIVRRRDQPFRPRHDRRRLRDREHRQHAAAYAAGHHRLRSVRYRGTDRPGRGRRGDRPRRDPPRLRADPVGLAAFHL
jgi:hypothetical protein